MSSDSGGVLIPIGRIIVQYIGNFLREYEEKCKFNVLRFYGSLVTLLELSTCFDTNLDKK